MKLYGLTFLKYVGYIFLTAKCILIWILGKQSHHEMVSNLIKCKLSVTFLLAFCPAHDYAFTSIGGSIFFFACF